jgi:hypothetical protein
MFETGDTQSKYMFTFFSCIRRKNVKGMSGRAEFTDTERQKSSKKKSIGRNMCCYL